MIAGIVAAARVLEAAIVSALALRTEDGIELMTEDGTTIDKES